VTLTIDKAEPSTMAPDSRPSVHNHPRPEVPASRSCQPASRRTLGPHIAAPELYASGWVEDRRFVVNQHVSACFDGRAGRS
jgi:hypothetical protein